MFGDGGGGVVASTHMQMLMYLCGLAQTISLFLLAPPQEQRCRNLSDSVMPNTKELLICQMCWYRQGGFNPGVRFPNKDVCYLCSNFTFSQSCCPARVCSFHAIKNRMSSHMSQCCVCHKPIFPSNNSRNQSFGPMPAQLCQFCGFGSYGKLCCEF